MILAKKRRLILRELFKIIWPLLLFFRSHRATLLNLALITIVLSVAPLLGILVVDINPLFVFIVLAMPLVLVAMQYLIPRPELAPVLILIAGAFIPIELPTGTESRLVDSFLLTILFVGSWLLKMLIVEKRLSLRPSPVNKPLLGFIFITLFSVIWSTLFRDPLVNPANLSKKFVFVQTASALTMIMLPGAFLLVANHINDLKLFKVMVNIMLVAGVVAVIGRLGFMPVGLVNDSGLFTMWVVSLSVALAFFQDDLSWKWRGLLLVLAGAWIYFRFGRQITWLAGWLPAFAVLGVLIFMRSKKMLLIAIALVVVLIVTNTSYLEATFANENDESGGTRMAAWEVNWRVTGKHLLFGTGPAGYAAYYMSYYPNEAMATHNNIIDILAQTGLVGLTLCLWFFFRLAWLGYKLCLRLKGRRDFTEALANAAFAGTVGCIMMMIFGDWLFPFTYTQTIAGFDYVVYSWLFMGAILVVDRLTSTEPKAPAEQILAIESPGSLHAA